MRRALLLIIALLALPATGLAETAYVTDKLYVSIREGQDQQSASVKSVATGTAVEVLQRVEGFVQVREPGGAEGWIAERYLVTTAPAKALLDISNNELQKAQTELDSLHQQLTASQRRAAEEARRAGALERKLVALEQSAAAVPPPPESTPSVESVSDSPVTIEATTASGFRFDWIWSLIAFAMLVTGFFSGVIWLREVNRKKMGGMYLRI